MSGEKNAPQPEKSEAEIISGKKENLEFLKEKGVEPYAYSFDRTLPVEGLLEKYGGAGEEEGAEDERAAGRIVSIRSHGKTAFMHIRDESGKIQAYIRRDILGEEKHDLFKKFDIGDIAGVSGPVFKTRTGELTIKVKELTLLTKSLLPLPEKWHGLKDKETRYRHRYLDLIANGEVKKNFETRISIIKEIRKFLDGRGFKEVETPMLHPIPGGAKARPFLTHHNALDIDLYMRIAPELYLKRLLVGGFERVYEINRNFRNEGISIKHNPEFTMLELYQAYTDYEGVMNLMEEMTVYLADTILNKRVITYQGTEIDLSPPWKRLSMKDAVKEHGGIDIDSLDDGQLAEKLKSRGAELRQGITRGELTAMLFEEFAEEKLIQPVFITDFPVEVSPLSKAGRKDKSIAERFEPYIFGREIGNGFSELNDAEDQEERFKKQIESDAHGEVSKEIDRDYIQALKTGMPPAGGLGVGIDRLVMFFTDSASIRDVILFPLLRPEGKGKNDEPQD
ncbi:MAG TPA: lysine--tRNA ligase [bacterium]|nr:lysine--tRNA ligase [bacterium]